MGFYSSHIWNNGAVLTVEKVNNTEISIRIQDDNETMLADFIMGNAEAMCLVQSIMTVLTTDIEYEASNIKKN